MILPISAIASLVYRVIAHLNNAVDLGHSEFGQPEGNTLKLLVSNDDYDVYVKLVKKPVTISVEAIKEQVQ